MPGLCRNTHPYVPDNCLGRYFLIRSLISKIEERGWLFCTVETVWKYCPESSVLSFLEDPFWGILIFYDSSVFFLFFFCIVFNFYFISLVFDSFGSSYPVRRESSMFIEFCVFD